MQERISAESVSPRRVISTQHDDDDDECLLISCGERRERTRTAVSRSNCRPALYLRAALLEARMHPPLVRAKSLVVIGSLDDLITDSRDRAEFAPFYPREIINCVPIKIGNT